MPVAAAITIVAIFVMKTLPGGLKDEIQIALPRPRSREIMACDRFHAIREQVINSLREESLKVFNRDERPSGHSMTRA